MEFRISFTLILTALTLSLTLVPAVVIWVVFMDLMTSSVDLLQGTTHDSMEMMALNIQELLMSQAMGNFDDLLTEGEKEMTALVSMIQANGVLAYHLWPSQVDLLNRFVTPFHTQTFNTMQGHPLFSQVAILADYFRNPNDTFTTHIAWVAWVAFFIDAVRNTSGTRTLYASHLAMAAGAQWTTWNISYVDQVTGKLLLPLLSETLPSEKFVLEYGLNGWLNTMQFNQYTGQVELRIRHWLPAQNGTWVQPLISIGASTISDELKSQLSGSPQDRLVLFFRQPHGYMIAASNGKYYSHSDVDWRYINPLVNPPNLSTYRLWTCLQSDDALINQACQQLYGMYQAWTAIPVLHQDKTLSGQQYWLATGFSSGNLQATVLLLKNRASVMGNIDASNDQVSQQVSDKKGITFVILGVVSAVAVVFPLAVGLWLAARLYTLATGMDRIAQLQFSGAALPPTVFRELHRFQASFTQMERGLQAFGRFVPQAVVKVLIAGQMRATDEMHPKTLTVMFADIEGFSTVAETVPPATLVAVCTEYFEALCGDIVAHHGTIDKFIGDCIMAMWNAPDHQPGHERDAVAAALAMQNSVLALHHGWKRRGQPLLRFRLGLHTGVCLVGNFGCSYRVSYTCLGDGVNLAARLEALNKKFGTYLCVSGATYEGCRDAFRFRRLAKVTVPGKAEVLPVYEVLCEVDGVDRCQYGTPKAASLPGAVHRDGDVRCADLDDGCSELSFPAAQPESGPQGSPRLYIQVGSPVHMDGAERLPGYVAYHWTRVNRAALLQHARQYEQAYEVLVEGDYPQAHTLLQAQPLLKLPDMAWDALARRLESTELGQRWDGVFRFTEK